MRCWVPAVRCTAKNCCGRRLHEEHDLFAISGSLLEPGTGVSATAGPPTAARAAGMGAAAVQDAATAALRAPNSKGSARAVAGTLLSLDKWGSLARTPARVALETPETDAAALAHFRGADRTVASSNGDVDDPARNGKRKKRKHRDGAATQTASIQPPAAAASQPTSTMPRVAAASTDAAQDVGSRPLKKRRRDREQAPASNWAAPAAVQHRQHQRVNVSIPSSSADGAPDATQPARKLKKKRTQQQASANADAAPQMAAKVPEGLADAALAKSHKRKDRESKTKRAAVVGADGQLLPNGVHGLAAEQPAVTAAVAAARANAIAGRAALQNGMVHHLDAAPRTKQKLKRKKAADGDLPGLAILT